ncbi:LPS export ABC transporter periplasmic protein LptC [Altericroceibacterium xinjiangense]|uniref:LPS export ABC transporter periplasmic protein LptC n=1 Tax=Altericroceibacterium xinjiangense TaxID=762261 RepID=UPI000F7E7ED2|nr:LPS export ABC transporter periplasmic protein LptC [Altericroceibacterium xinjiangense]
MTARADRIRNRRRAFAAPGGTHDRIVRWLAIGLPALVGVVTAFMIITPLSPRGEVSFLLDRNKVATADNRFRVADAMYRGEDAKGRPFSLRAGEAVQPSAADPVVRLRELVARILLPEGPAVLSANAGLYNTRQNEVKVDGIVRFMAADGYRMTARNVVADLAEKTLFGNGTVEGEIPAGTFRADTMRADLAERTIVLEGDARMRMIPAQLRRP